MSNNSNIIFPTATELRNNSRSYLIILNEVRAIENAVLLAADNGMLDAIVFNTYMTNITPSTYKDIVAVDDVNDTLTVTNHGYVKGDEIRFTASTNDLPAPLTTSATYYAIPSISDPSLFQVATSYLNAINDVAINITDTGSGTNQVRVTTPAEQYYRTWKGLSVDRALIDQMNGVISHFKQLGYTISRHTNQSNPDVFEWHISW